MHNMRIDNSNIQNKRHIVSEMQVSISVINKRNMHRWNGAQRQDIISLHCHNNDVGATCMKKYRRDTKGKGNNLQDIYIYDLIYLFNLSDLLVVGTKTNYLIHLLRKMRLIGQIDICIVQIIVMHDNNSYTHTNTHTQTHQVGVTNNVIQIILWMFLTCFSIKMYLKHCRFYSIRSSYQLTTYIFYFLNDELLIRAQKSNHGMRKGWKAHNNIYLINISAPIFIYFFTKIMNYINKKCYNRLLGYFYKTDL